MWVYIAWHLKGGPSLDEWRSMTKFERAAVLHEVKQRIERHNGDLDE